MDTLDNIKQSLKNLSLEEYYEIKKYIQKKYIAKERKRQSNKRYQNKLKEQKRHNEELSQTK